MLISKNWLHDFVFLPDSLEPEELAKNLTLHTVEVEGWNVQAELLDNVVIGLVKSVTITPTVVQASILYRARI